MSAANANEIDIKSILLAEQLDMDFIRDLGHKVRQYLSVKDDAAALMGEIKVTNLPNRDTRIAALYWVLGNNEMAESFAQKESKSHVALLILGEIAESEGNYAEALNVYDKAIALAGTESACALSKLSVKVKLGMYEEVLQDIDKLEREFGDKADLFYCKGRCYEFFGDYEEAVEAYENALELDDEHCETLFYLAKLLDLRGDDQGAIEYYKRIGPGSENAFSNAFLNLASLYEDNHNFEEAIHCCEMLLANDPNNKRAKMLLESAEASISMYYSPEETKQSEKLEAILRVPVTDFELSVRSRNCLAKMNIRTLGDLVKRTESEMLAYKNFGETSLREIRDMLVAKNLRLGMMREDAATRAAFNRSSSKQKEEILGKPIDELELSVRSRKCMDRMGIKTIGELCEKSEIELASAKNFGRVSLNEIKKRLQEANLSLKQDDKI